LERNERREHAEEGGFAAAVGAEDGEDFAGGDFERQVVDGASLAVAIGDVSDGDGGGHGRFGQAINPRSLTRG
jgi:hypothetical protein